MNLSEIVGSAVRGTMPAPAPTGPVKIEIPLDHPKAQYILKLAATLATQQQLPSGIVINKLLRPGAEEEFLGALREMGIDVDQIKEALAPGIAANKERATLNDLAKTAESVLPLLAPLLAPFVQRRR
jgi:hypothetical protein